MTRTIGFFFQSLEKRQVLIKSLTTLKTDNSRLRETIAVRSQQVEEMTSQLQAVATAKQDLYDLLTKLFARFEKVKAVQSEIHTMLVNQQDKAAQMKDALSSMSEQFQENEKLFQASEKNCGVLTIRARGKAAKGNRTEAESRAMRDPEGSNKRIGGENRFTPCRTKGKRRKTERAADSHRSTCEGSV